MTTIAIIPARGGSKRIPHKNISRFHGKPIIAYSIEKAFDSGLFDRIIVSTDDVEIGQVAAKCGAVVWMRDPAYGKDDIGTQEVMMECLMGIGANWYDSACCIYATAPLMSVDDLAEGYRILNGWHGDYVTYVMSAGYPPLQDAAQFYWGLAGSFMDGEPLIGLRTRLICVDASRVCDINTPEDWDHAYKMYEDLNK